MASSRSKSPQKASLTCFAVTAPGLEAVCAAELRALGIDAAAEPGGVAWQGTADDVYRANLQAEQLFTAIFFSSLLGLLVFWMFGWLSNRVVGSWHESAVDET